MKILTALVAMILSLVVVEAGLRLAGIEYPIFYDFDPILGNKLKPGVKGYYLDEGKGFVSINSDGMRDREHPLSPPAGTLRIAVLGDSYAEAMQVDEQEAFFAVLEKELQGCDQLHGRKVEVLNFGQSGFGTTQELLTLQHRVWKYSPDVVLLAFTTGNDVADNSRVLKQIDYHPYHVYQNGQLILEDGKTRENWQARQNSWWQRLGLYRLASIRVFQVIHHAKGSLWQWWILQEFGVKSIAAVQGKDIGLSNKVYHEPKEDVWKEAWRVTEGVLLEIRDEVAQKGAQFVVVVLTNSVQVDPDVSKRMVFANWLGVGDLFYPERRLASFCQKHGISILLLGPPFQEYATRNQVYLHGFGKNLGSGHWNQAGHRLAGHLIAEWLCPQLR
ncbi:MAG: SGNH/GDSL hydrolase family protein [Desulfobaccales bacterium]